MNLENGQSLPLVGDSVDMFSADAEFLYTYSLGNAKLSRYSSDGNWVLDTTLQIETELLSVNEMLVTDDYYVFVCSDKSKSFAVTQYNIYDKKTLEMVNSVTEKSSTATPVRKYCTYKDNTFLKAEESQHDSRTFNVYAVDVESGKITALADMNVNQRTCDFDFVFNPRTQTLFVYTGPVDGSDSEASIVEYSLNDPDNIVQQRHYFENTNEAKYFVSVYENIVLTLCSLDDAPRYLDCLNLPESITLACRYSAVYDDVIYGFERESGILVRTVNYGSDTTRLDLKLMAGDTDFDFDLFEPIYLYQHKYFLSGYYEDLTKYDSLKQRLDSHLAANIVSKLGDTYVGIPTYIANSYNKNSYDSDGSPRAYSIMMSKIIYCAYNFDVTTKSYYDTDGKELYKLLRFIYDNPNGNEVQMPFGDDCFVIDNGFLVMNPSSSNKENTVKFLEYAFDFWNDDSNESYLNLDSDENVYVYWHSFAWDYVEPIYTAANTVSQSDGKASTIKKIAADAAYQVRMRLQG